MRSTWMPEAEALANLAQAAADDQAWQECLQAYLAAAREGSLEARGRRSLFATVREPIPREDWQHAQWLELPVRGMTGFHFVRGGKSFWHDREVRRADIDALQSRSPEQQRIARREAAIRAAIAQGVRPETTAGGWKEIAKLIRAACSGVTAETRGFSDKHIERVFRAELRPRDRHRPKGHY
jgi:hypothetical protein